VFSSNPTNEANSLTNLVKFVYNTSPVSMEDSIAQITSIGRGRLQVGDEVGDWVGWTVGDTVGRRVIGKIIIVKVLQVIELSL